MKDRKMQREIRHAIGRQPKMPKEPELDLGSVPDVGQEGLDSRNHYGNSDPTPRRAVRNIIRRQKPGLRMDRKEGSHACI